MVFPNKSQKIICVLHMWSIICKFAVKVEMNN